MTAAQTINGALRKLPIWPIYLIGALPPVWYFYLGLTGGLGVEPIKEFEHRLGILGLQMLIAVLAVTPLRNLTKVSLIRFRRAMGLLTFYYIAAHLAVWLFLDVQIAAQIWADIVKRPYITIGMVGFVLMIPLAITSNNLSVRKLGARWRKLHKLVYPIALLGAVHFVMLRKGWQIEPLLYLAGIALLLALRLPILRRVGWPMRPARQG
ncbi:protein-methionine-sulfoxide reductase heme-binding subunit MsrQ [Maritimibacter fusiformis]|uniref:Protein-methionine-sulfoxide reductase heme-binding subunit MsrQ n=1 Tax=Maritimibacter fusiformis TaxID=2603819 RepID=A0A5D0R8V9_9RHOB|nr:protein-methionine-sulfoxide reductase heme-binding subunit MsrQ [Maritimibacter fusiformis]TYB77529.1 protein-methionine-sulfoxide reductase heme-binding subunit MsrQ [Maritimibacter fusiformis]